jgi:hypothetical protein
MSSALLEFRSFTADDDDDDAADVAARTRWVVSVDCHN